MPRYGGSLFYRPKPRTKEIRRKRWNWPSIVWTAVKKACMVVGAFVLFSALLGTISAVSLMGRSAPPLPQEMILTLTLDNGIGETALQPTFMDPFPFRRPTVRQIVDTLDRAALDKRVHGLLVNIQGAGLSPAHIQEVRAALKRFRAAGKFAKIYSSSYGDYSRGLGLYYFASTFDEIWMQPVGMLSISGINLEMPFVRKALNKIGVTPHFIRREKYKSAMESFTHSGMSEANRESLASIVNDLSDVIVRDIAADRDIPQKTLKSLIDKGLLTGQEALKAKLIDRLDYADVLVSELREKISGDPDGEEPGLIPLHQYRAATHPKPGRSGFGRRDGEIALVYVTGAIMPTEAAEGVAAADDISDALHDIADDPALQAVVLRIDSPGGSPSASETIRRAIMRVKEKGKHVIVSMGPTAASGGYWVAADADRIFALPSTLTGSIGVVMGKVELGGLWDKLGVNWQGVRFGQNADLWSMNGPFSKSGTERVNALADDVYDAFLTRVSQGRNIPRNKLRKIAQGRAWTGVQAKEVGLVDDLGGLDDALDYTAKTLGLEDRHDLDITVLPHPDSPVEQLLEALGQQVRIGRTLDSAAPWLEKLQTLSFSLQADRYGAYDPVADAAAR